MSQEAEPGNQPTPLNRAMRRAVQRANRNKQPGEVPQQRRPRGRPRKYPIDNRSLPTGITNDGGIGDGATSDGLGSGDTMDAPIADTPPVEKRKRGRAPRMDMDAKIIEGMTALYGSVGMLWMLANQYDGVVILECSEKMARADLEACKQNAEAYRILKMIAVGNIWTVLLMAHVAPIVGILANHGVVSRNVPEKLGLPRPPEPEPKPEPQAGSDEWIAQQREEGYYQQQAAQAMNEAGVGQVGSMAGGLGGPIGDASTVAAQRTFTAEQIASIREQALRAALAEQERARTSPDSRPPAEYNPMGSVQQ